MKDRNYAACPVFLCFLLFNDMVERHDFEMILRVQYIVIGQHKPLGFMSDVMHRKIIENIMIRR